MQGVKGVVGLLMVVLTNYNHPTLVLTTTTK
jgi:hypothetical protein